MATRALLTEKHIEKAKPAPSGKRVMLWDAITPSLALRITEKGHKSFVIQRRVNGRMVKLTLGEYPALSLAQAREKARNSISEMLRGFDPRQSQSVRVTGSGLRRDSFEAAVETYIKREVEKNRRPRTQDEIVRPLRKLIPRWGTLPVSEIGPQEILAALDEIVDAGTPVAANRTYSVLRRFFGWCIERHLLKTNPAANLRKPAKEESRTRALDDNELGEVWRAAEDLGWPFGNLVRALMLTGQRRNEVTGLRWEEINFTSGEWTIPPGRTKNGREHVVPLTGPLLTLLRGSPALQGLSQGSPSGAPPRPSGGRSPIQGGPPEATSSRPRVALGYKAAPSGAATLPASARPGGVPAPLPGRPASLAFDSLAEVSALTGFVFTTTGKSPVSGYSRAKAALDTRISETRARAGRGVKPMPNWTLHDLRRSCATGMARMGIQPHIIEVVLNHSGGFRSGVAGVYQRHPYLEERRAALQLWADHVASLPADAASTSNVVPLRSMA